MSERLILLEHAYHRIRRGDESGRRTELKPQQVLAILKNPSLYVPYRGKVSDGRVFFSPRDQKCLVAWLENCGTHHKVHTIENHHHRIPVPVLLQAEQNVLGNVVFLRRPVDPTFSDPVYDVVCRTPRFDQKITLKGYLYPGVSWWRFAKNLRQVLGFIEKLPLDGTEPLIFEGRVWHGQEKKHVQWNDYLPLSFPRELYRSGKAGAIPDFMSIASRAPPVR